MEKLFHFGFSEPCTYSFKAMANIYSSSRPLHGSGPQTQQFNELSEFAYNQVRGRSRQQLQQNSSQGGPT